MKTLLIGGTGFSQMDYMDNVKAETVRTPFGGAVIYQGTYKSIPVGFLPRHGMHHEHLAPQVNYRANIWAAKELGYSRILGTSAVATLNPNINVGDLVLLDQLVDFTEGRDHTFYLRSANMTDPFCSQMSQIVQKSAEELEIPLHATATYLCFKGPRYETAAEIRLFQSWGMDVIGMTVATEAALCREIRICYATIALVTNAGAGLSEQGPDLARHRQVTTENLPKFKSLTLRALQELPTDRNCQCAL